MQIVIDNVFKQIKGVSVLKGVNLEFSSGYVYGLQGPNGSGKTMLMRLIAGLIHPTSGRVLLDSQVLGKDIDFPQSMGLLIENPAFLPNYTGLKNLELLAEIKGHIGKEEICGSLSDVGLFPEDKKKYKKYSLGMKQRLGIAAAIMEKPDLILLDEPTNALDEQGAEMVRDLIQRERSRGAMIILASHDVAFLEYVTDEIFMFKNGHVHKRINVSGCLP